MKLNIVDNTFAHCNFSSNPLPPVNTAKYIEWVRKDSNNDLVVYTDNNIPDHKSSNSVAWLLEPREIKSIGYNYVIKNAEKFSSIWSYDKEIIDNIPNAQFSPFGGCWIENIDRKIHNKTKNFSIIASNKKQTEGHKLRHKIISASSNKIDTYGGGYNPIDNKIEGLKDYRFHFVIENVKRDYFFTEKLIDCFITGTIPIFWGCPSIGDFFDIEGMIIFHDLLELKEKLKLCTESFYNDKIDIIKDNFCRAEKYTLAEDWIYNNILSND